MTNQLGVALRPAQFDYPGEILAYSHYLSAHFIGRGYPEALVEAAVGHSVIALWERLVDGSDPVPKPGCLMFVVAIRHLRMLRRAEARRRTEPLPDEVEAPTRSERAYWEHDPHLRDAIDSLPRLMKWLVIESYFDGYALRTLAVRWSLTEHAVRRDLRDAMAKLADILTARQAKESAENPRKTGMRPFVGS